MTAASKNMYKVKFFMQIQWKWVLWLLKEQKIKLEIRNVFIIIMKSISSGVSELMSGK